MMRRYVGVHRLLLTGGVDYNNEPHLWLDPFVFSILNACSFFCMLSAGTAHLLGHSTKRFVQDESIGDLMVAG